MTSELDPRARELIGLALRGERHLPRNRERVHRGVLAAVAAPAALGLAEPALAAGKAAGLAGSGAAGAKATLLGAATWLKATPIVLVSFAAGVAGVQQLRSSEAVEHDTKPVTVAVAPTAAPVAKTSPAPSLPFEIEPEPPAPTSVKPSRPSLAAPVGADAPSLAPPSLAVELEALQRAQRTLNAGNAAGALLELRAVTGSALRAERTALEVFAHCALGNVAQARQHAALFRKLAPRSPLLPRVNASCAGE